MFIAFETGPYLDSLRTFHRDELYGSMTLLAQRCFVIRGLQKNIAYRFVGVQVRV